MLKYTLLLKAVYVFTCFNAKSLLFVYSFFKTSSEKDLFALMYPIG